MKKCILGLKAVCDDCGGTLTADKATLTRNLTAAHKTAAELRADKALLTNDLATANDSN